jgi:ketosteroid isomerase-like protein
MTGLQGGVGVVDNAQREIIVAAVEGRMRSYEAAYRDRDADRFLALLASVPEFQMYDDGRPATYDQVAAGMRATFARFRSLESPFSNVRVSVLSAEYALVTATLNRAVTDNAGTVTRSHGAATVLWRRINGQWLIVYGQFDHRPDAGS